jgi:DNA-binding transcriptional LysR family regulator
VQRAGSLTAAARVLGCSQPTVGRRVAGLARGYAAALFETRAGERILTAAGRQVLARAERVEREMDALGREVRGVDELPEGSVRLSAPEGLGLFVIAPRLDGFRRDHPGIDLLLSSETHVVDLSRREADLALRTFRPRQPSLVVRRVGRVEFSLYASAAYLARRPRDKDKVLPAEDIVALHEEQAQSNDFAWLRRHVPEGHIRVRVRSPLGIRAAVLAGAGAGLLAPYVADDASLRRLTGPPALVRDLYLVYHRALRRLVRVTIVSRFVIECLGTM